MARLNAKVGDRFWTMLERVSSSNSVLAASPYNTPFVHVDKESVRNHTPIEEIEEENPSEVSFAERTKFNDAVYVETTQILSGTPHVKVVHEEETPDQCPLNFPGHEGPELPEEEESVESRFKANRENPIEWTGTGQSIQDEIVENRTETFTQSDVRGDKNDLLSGHL